MMTEKEIVIETVQYYMTHDRSVKDGNCLYTDENGNHCALGRCIKPYYLKKISEYGMDSSRVSPINAEFKLAKILIDKYKGHSLEFWMALQNLHDDKTFWINIEKGKNLLTEEAVSYIKIKFDFDITPYLN